jgi:copper(I)-binding protein
MIRSTRHRRWLAALAALACTFAPALASAAPPTVTQAWARATPPGLTVGAAYLALTGGSGPDRLVGASSPRASMVQIHVIVESNGVAGMREVDGVDVPAGRTVVLAPGGTHLMLMGLDGPLVAGQDLPLTLEFEHAGRIDVVAKVRPAGDPGPAGR